MKTIYIPLIVSLLTLSSCFTIRTSGNYGHRPSPAPAPPSAPVQEIGPKRIQLALILDTSGSMDDLLEHAKTEFWYIVDELMYAYEGRRPPQLELALYEYGNKYIGRQDDYVRQVVPLTTDLDWIADELWNLRSKGKREYDGLVIDRAVQELQWSRDPYDLKLIYIIGNESFRDGPVDPYRAIDRACAKDIEVHTLFCGTYEEGLALGWKDGAFCGSYAALDFRAPIEVYETVYDNRIVDLNYYYNETFLPYGTYGNTYYDRCVRQDRYFQSYGPAWLCVRTTVKTGPFYYNPRWDLIDAIDYGYVDLNELPRDQWPREIRNYSVVEAGDYIERKRRKRNELREQIHRLNVQRRQEVRQKMPKVRTDGKTAYSSINTAMMGTIQNQGQQITRPVQRAQPQADRPGTDERPPAGPATRPVKPQKPQVEPPSRRPVRETQTREEQRRKEEIRRRDLIEQQQREAEAKRQKQIEQERRAREVRRKEQIERERKEAEARRKVEIERQKRETEIRRREEMERERRETEARRKEQIERERRQEEAREKAAAERLKQEEEARRQALIEQRRKEIEAQQKAQEARERREREIRHQEQLEQQRQEAKRRRQEQLEKKRQEQIERQRQEAEQRRQEQLERQRREAEARRQAEIEQQRREAEVRRQQQAEHQRQEAEARRQAQIEQQRRETEARRQEQAERQRREAEARRQAQVEQQRREAEARRKEQAEQQRRETEDRRQAEAERQRREVESRQREQVQRRK